jgi:hypothetical protein
MPTNKRAQPKRGLSFYRFGFIDRKLSQRAAWEWPFVEDNKTPFADRYVSMAPVRWWLIA